MRAILALAAAVALAAYFLICDPFGTPEPERCPGGICPTPAHSLDQSASPYSTDDLFGDITAHHPTPAESGPILRAVTKDQVKAKPKPLPVSKTGWRMRLLFPRDSENIANDILREINDNENLSDWCSFHAFGTLSTDDKRFDEWEDLGYPPDVISLVLVSPDNRSVYYTHYVPKSPTRLLSLLQESKSGYEDGQKMSHLWEPMQYQYSGGSHRW